MSKPTFRVGLGHDIHRLQQGGQLVLGGVVVAEGLSPVAHSDGDVVYHALVDALLGAAGLGDIGEWFANSDPQWRSAPSRIFVERVMEQLRAQGWVVANADLLILAERPKLKAFKEQMRRNVSELLGCAVNIKAGTNEGCDAVGRGEAIAAQAVVLVEMSTD